jgi:hypothetical protein
LVGWSSHRLHRFKFPVSLPRRYSASICGAKSSHKKERNKIYTTMPFKSISFVKGNKATLVNR